MWLVLYFFGQHCVKPSFGSEFGRPCISVREIRKNISDLCDLYWSLVAFQDLLNSLTWLCLLEFYYKNVPVSWCLMKVGFGVCPSGSRAVCESKDLCWEGIRNDQAVTRLARRPSALPVKGRCSPSER